jgi:adenylate kinase
LTVDNEVVVARLLKRAEIEGRADDNEETIRERMRVYDSETAPLLKFYQKTKVLIEVSGMGAIEEVGQRVRDALN